MGRRRNSSLSRVPGQVDLRINQGQVDPTDLEGSPDVQIWGSGFFHFVGKDYKPLSVPKSKAKLLPATTLHLNFQISLNSLQ